MHYVRNLWMLKDAITAGIFHPVCKCVFVHFTSLPDVCRWCGVKGVNSRWGKDTETAIRAGVLKGMEYEISGYIMAMKHKYPELLVFFNGRG